MEPKDTPVTPSPTAFKIWPLEPLTALSELRLEVTCGNGAPGGILLVVGGAKTSERAASIDHFLAQVIENAAQVPSLKAKNEELEQRLAQLEQRMSELIPEVPSTVELGAPVAD
jgi:hypothetical protein